MRETKISGMNGNVILHVDGGEQITLDPLVALEVGCYLMNIATKQLHNRDAGVWGNVTEQTLLHMK